MERRSYPLEVRLAPGSDVKTLAGRAAVFNTLSTDMGGWKEQIAPGAFKRSLDGSEHDIVALWAHDSSKPLASRALGDLTLSEDDAGLSFELTPKVLTSWTRDAIDSVAGGLIRQMSFGFLVHEGGDTWHREKDGMVIRTVYQADLFEISPVAFAAYRQTGVEARGAHSSEGALAKFLESEKRESQNPAHARFKFAIARNNNRRAALHGHT